MGIETLDAMSDGRYLGLLLLVIKFIVLITVFLISAGFATYLVGLAWFCFEEARRSRTAPRKVRRAVPPNIWESAPRAPNSTAFTHSDHAALRQLQFTAMSREKPRRLAR